MWPDHRLSCVVQEVARCNGSLQVARQQGAELRSERDELKTRYVSCSVLPSRSLCAACGCSDPAFAVTRCLRLLTVAVCMPPLHNLRLPCLSRLC